MSQNNEIEPSDPIPVESLEPSVDEITRIEKIIIFVGRVGAGAFAGALLIGLFEAITELIFGVIFGMSNTRGGIIGETLRGAIGGAVGGVVFAAIFQTTGWRIHGAVVGTFTGLIAGIIAEMMDRGLGMTELVIGIMGSALLGAAIGAVMESIDRRAKI